MSLNFKNYLATAAVGLAAACSSTGGDIRPYGSAADGTTGDTTTADADQGTFELPVFPTIDAGTVDMGTPPGTVINPTPDTAGAVDTGSTTGPVTNISADCVGKALGALCGTFTCVTMNTDGTFSNTTMQEVCAQTQATPTSTTIQCVAVGACNSGSSGGGNNNNGNNGNNGGTMQVDPKCQGLQLGQVCDVPVACTEKGQNGQFTTTQIQKVCKVVKVAAGQQVVECVGNGSCNN